MAASRSAVAVTLVRAHLTWMGVVDDPLALDMLPPRMRTVATTLRLPGLRRLAQHRTLPYLAARTLVFDDRLGQALGDGIDQVVIVGAGYDSRAWRMARPGVTFFEVDQPATQEQKRLRAPEGGPRYVPVDATDARLTDHLTAAGFDTGRPAVFLPEGLVVYLAEQEVADLLGTLAVVAAPGSCLVVSFEKGFERRPATRPLAKIVYRGSGETTYFRLPAERAPDFLRRAGWTPDPLLTADDLRRHLEGSPLTTMGEGDAFIAAASR